MQTPQFAVGRSSMWSITNTGNGRLHFLQFHAQFVLDGVEREGWRRWGPQLAARRPVKEGTAATTWHAIVELKFSVKL